MTVLKAIIVAMIGLIIGDFLSTFIWHVPQHAFGKLHLKMHHSKNQSFWDYVALTPKPRVMLDSMLSALSPCLFFLVLCSISMSGSIMGCLLGQAHFIWRHGSALGWQTPALVVRLCEAFYIVTPEYHWKHHENSRQALGDIFTFYDAPARAWWQFLLSLKRKYRQRSAKLATMVLLVDKEHAQSMR